MQINVAPVMRFRANSWL